MRIYLDNCCYNRPYDDQSQMRINLDTQAKLYIQLMIKDKKIELVTSYVLDFENSKNRVIQKKLAISTFMEENESYYVGEERQDEIRTMVRQIMDTGVKEKDAAHVACAIYAKSDYFITTDDRLLKYTSDQVKILTPGEFIREIEVKANE
ncbi:hypothetical protein [Emergencia sp.]|uniref:hypothetical protein n=1 Tax=Emergencia sp. TaxID=1926557 RepID=UPI003AF1C68E